MGRTDQDYLYCRPCLAISLLLGLVHLSLNLSLRVPLCIKPLQRGNEADLYLSWVPESQRSPHSLEWAFGGVSETKRKKSLSTFGKPSLLSL